MPTTYCLEVRWTISRGRDTYGYNICTFIDCSTGNKYSCDGGGYDMIGTSFGLWLQDKFQDRLKTLKIKEDLKLDNRARKYYGASLNYEKDGEVILDGGCGIMSMERIAKAIGLETLEQGKGKTRIFVVHDTWEEKHNVAQTV